MQVPTTTTGSRTRKPAASLSKKAQKKQVAKPADVNMRESKVTFPGLSRFAIRSSQQFVSPITAISNGASQQKYSQQQQLKRDKNGRIVRSQSKKKAVMSIVPQSQDSEPSYGKQFAKPREKITKQLGTNDKLFSTTGQHESTLGCLSGQLKRALDLAKCQKGKRMDVPKSYIIAEVLFEKRVYGTSWIFCELKQITTQISSEKNFAIKLQRVKPKIRIARSFSDDVNSTTAQTIPARLSGGSLRQSETSSLVPQLE